MSTGTRIDTRDLKSALFVEMNGRTFEVTLPPERMQLVLQLAGSLGDDGALPLSLTHDFNFEARGMGAGAAALAERLLNPNDLGYVANAEVRDAAREALGRQRCETDAQSLRALVVTGPGRAC